MAKTANNKSSSTMTAGDAQKQQKKQAKREAKMMLAVEKAKAALQKSEQKIAKARARLETRTAHLSTLESKLAELRSSTQESKVSTPAPGTGSDHQQGRPEPETIAAGTADEEQHTAVLSATHRAATHS